MDRIPIAISLGSAVVVLAAAGLLAKLAPDSFRYWKDVLEALSFLVILLGVPIGLVQYFRVVKKEQIDREYGTTHSMKSSLSSKTCAWHIPTWTSSTCRIRSLAR
jgi:hypothetical protein